MSTEGVLLEVGPRRMTLLLALALATLIVLQALVLAQVMALAPAEPAAAAAPVAADVNGDGAVDVLDVQLVVNAYLAGGGGQP